MKRLYVAVALLAAVVALCVYTSLYQNRRTDRLLDTLDRIETHCRLGDKEAAVAEAAAFATEYQRVSRWMRCYIPHSELQESRETAATLPNLLQKSDRAEIWFELARLREQLEDLRQVDSPTLWNIL